MSFDEHLRRAFGPLADRLHDETLRQLATLSDELGDAFDAERTTALAEGKAAAEKALAADIAAAVAAAEARANEALAVAKAEAREAREAGRNEGLAIGRKEGHDEGRREGLEQGKQTGLEQGKQEALAAAKEETEKARGESQQLSERAHQEGRDQARAELRALELASNERLIETIRSIDRGRSLSEILETLIASAGREAKRVGVLLVRGGQLRGWRFIGFGSALDDRHDFEVPAAGAGLIADAARTGSAVSADSATKASVPSFAELPPGREMLAVPVPMSGQVVAVLYADQGPGDVSDAEMRVAWPTTLEVMARHAARCLEAMTAFRAAQVLTERPDLPSAQDSDKTRGPKAADARDKDDADQAARRYARLLVSEIKMYHEAAVVAGRRDRDLGTRLGGEIARARALYEQRVPAEARKLRDHFQEELVGTLADGDASVLEVKK